MSASYRVAALAGLILTGLAGCGSSNAPAGDLGRLHHRVGGGLWRRLAA